MFSRLDYLLYDFLSKYFDLQDLDLLFFTRLNMKLSDAVDPNARYSIVAMSVAQWAFKKGRTEELARAAVVGKEHMAAAIDLIEELDRPHRGAVIAVEVRGEKMTFEAPLALADGSASVRVKGLGLTVQKEYGP